MKFLRHILHNFGSHFIDHDRSSLLSLPTRCWSECKLPAGKSLGHEAGDIDLLLVSCPNHGGLVLVDSHQARVVDQADTTGVFITAHGIARAIQKECVHWYGSGEPRLIPFDPDADLHDVLVHENVLYMVRTGANEVVAEDMEQGIKYSWTFPGKGDAWHLNCLGVVHDQVLVSAFGKFFNHRGYKGHTKGAGIIMDLYSGEVLVRGLSQPHSITGAGRSLWLCNSEEQEILLFEDFKLVERVKLHGYPRGLALSRRYLYVGISNSRNAQIDGGPLDGDQAEIVVLRRDSLARQGTIKIPFKEIYEIRAVPGELEYSLAAHGQAALAQAHGGA